MTISAYRCTVRLRRWLHLRSTRSSSSPDPARKDHDDSFKGHRAYREAFEFNGGDTFTSRLQRRPTIKKLGETIPIRALDLRRATIFTPGRSRRRSLREQRETPRDILRALGQMLAPKSNAIASSSPPVDEKRSSLAKVYEEDEDDDLPIDAPRLSLPIDVDDDSDLRPPRLSGLEEENYTMQSIEYPRRAIDETEERRNTLALNRESGVGLDPIPDVNESTFMMNLEATHNEDLSVPPLEADDDPPSDFQNEPFLYEQDDHDDEELVEYMRAGDDQEPVNDEDEGSVQEETVDGTMLNLSSRKRKGGPKISQHGIEYPSLPPAVIKRLAQTFAQTSGVANAKITPDTLDALSQASDWFFEQLGDSLQAYAKHAGRKTIDESDVIALMRSPMQVPVPTKKRRTKAPDHVEGEE
ncbi:unnamed protein product [Parascedosporium putredinis]|uniref:CENP-T/Histone H4 histone fold domain-containing protein n=1 Tax=Parascedosporium putredinis TaxID=1442378 RepID=A0A9P1M5G6_9PEZI|nr:unnamed protein product [Parascedosporium putredinis]CAI7988059.1 unnamed protein product [Parascedosporium putredinis]